jgi:acyl carrier protein
MTATENRLQEIFRDLFDDEEIALRPDMTAKDVAGWDSLKNVKLIVQIEKAFKIRFATGEVVGIKNVGELLALIEQKSAAS